MTGGSSLTTSNEPLAVTEKVVQLEPSSGGRSWSSDGVCTELRRNVTDQFCVELMPPFDMREEILAGLWSPNEGWVKVSRSADNTITPYISAQASVSSNTTESVSEYVHCQE